MARPREFDIDVALENAMQAFWSHGYESTSMADLMEAMDLQKGSIYKAFGDKHTLFIQAMERYLEDAHEFDKSMIEKAVTPKEALNSWFNKEMKRMCGQPLKRGCLMVNSLTEFGSQDEDVARLVKEHSSKTANLIAKTIEKGQSLGEFRNDMSANDQAQLILVSLVGMLALTKGPMSKSASLKNINNILMLIEK